MAMLVAANTGSSRTVHQANCDYDLLVALQVADWAPKIESIVEWFGQLEKVDVEGVPPAVRADLEGENTLREDEVVRPEGQPDLLQQAPGREGPFVRVPKIATAADS
jgi:aspartyl-tRNA(Asn)/glutamyl-tRNA(Gln) amidotransferase subunit C